MMITRYTRAGIAVAVAGLSASCWRDPLAVSAPAPPTFTSARAQPNVYNVLSAHVIMGIRGADSAAIRYGSAGAAADSVTPAVPVTSDSAAVPVLGLLPDHAYRLRPVAFGPGGTVVGSELAFRTDPMPADVPRYQASGTDPSPGYTVLAAGLYGLVLDNSGRVVWYRRFAGGPGLNFIAQPNGRYAARPPNGAGDTGHWIEVDALGAETRALGCARGLRPRLHDLVAEPDGSYWLLCDETRVVDLAAFGGVAGAQVTGTVVQHVSADGSLRFEWNPFDHFAITDVDARERSGIQVNWTHGNAIAFDVDGNLIVSFRNLSEVTKIDVRSGDVLWRLGGLRNEFDVVGAPTPPFAGQHSVRIVAPETLVLLDNVGDPAQSRAERYAIDERTRTARLVQSFGAPGVTTMIGGSVQPLPGGRTLVSFGTAGRVVEYDAGGRVVWQIDGNAGYVFRAQRIRSLYSPGADLAR